MEKKQEPVEKLISYLKDYNFFQNGVMYELSCKTPRNVRSSSHESLSLSENIVKLQGVYCERGNHLATSVLALLKVNPFLFMLAI
jgi:hypothetical protein